MFGDILAGVQAIAESFMIDEVTLTVRKPADNDDENPFGDDTPEYETTTVTVPAWIVSPSTRSLDDQGGMNVVVDTATLRVPVGTVINRGTKVLHNGVEFRVVGDPSDDESWPAMIKVAIARQE